MSDKAEDTSRQEVVLVDETGRDVGLAAAEECHRPPGMLHRALTCLLVGLDGRLLLARRSRSKPTWPGYWDGTVATHQRPVEDDVLACSRRIKEELGTSPSNLQHLGHFTYFASYGTRWCEREYCAVLIGRTQATGLHPAADEVDDLTWIKRQDLASFTRTHPVTPWFGLLWERVEPRSGLLTDIRSGG